MGCSLIERDLETSQVTNLVDASETHRHGGRKYETKHGGWISAEQEMAKKNH